MPGCWQKHHEGVVEHALVWQVALESKLERLTSLCNRTTLQICHASPLSFSACRSLILITPSIHCQTPLHNSFLSAPFTPHAMHSSPFLYIRHNLCPRMTTLTTPPVVSPQPPDPQHNPHTTHRPTTNPTAPQPPSIARPPPTSRPPRPP